MNLWDRCVIVFGKSVSVFLRLTRLGSGATWPGEIALRLSPGLLENISRQNITLIAVAGTNGKTTTVKMIETVLRALGKKVRHNDSGANLDNGLVSSFLSDMTWWGTLKSKYFIFEIDEATLPNVLPKLHPKIVILLNLFRDQLDRYGEVDTIASKWTETLKAQHATYIINADDPHLAYIALQLKSKVMYFGLENKDLYLPAMQHATDTIYCPKCGHRLTFGGVYYSHLGKWACGKCGLTHPHVDITSDDFRSPLEGVYNKYNTLAAAAACNTLGIQPSEIQHALGTFTPAFGRMETVTYKGKNVTILLSKNPTGFNESLRVANNGPLLLVLNDRIPDGTDVSWIWDVDFEQIQGQKIHVSGDRCYEIALRIKYAGLQSEVYENLEMAIQKAVESTVSTETLWILATYSGMLDVRKILTGRKIL